MKVFNLKVEDSNSLCKILNPNILNNRLSSISEPDNHSSTKRTGINPALAFYIERVLRRGIDGFLLTRCVLNGHMGDLIA